MFHLNQGTKGTRLCLLSLSLTLRDYLNFCEYNDFLFEISSDANCCARFYKFLGNSSCITLFGGSRSWPYCLDFEMNMQQPCLE